MARTRKFSEEFREWRGTRTQPQAAKALRIKLRTVRNWEQGCSEPPLIEVVRQAMAANRDLS